MSSRFSKAYLAGLLAVLTGAAVLAGCGTDSTSSGGGGGGVQTIQIWEGYTEAEAKAFAHLVAEYEAQHPGQKVSTLFVNNDNTLQKVLTAVRGGSPPDIAYLYGSWAPNVAQIPQVVNLTQVVKRPGVNWNDFWTGERAVATVNGKVIGIPAAGGQPGRGLQQDAVRQGRAAAAGPGLDLAGVRGRREEADQPGDQAVRHRLRHPGHRGHRVALGGAALGGGRPAADAGQQEGGVRLGRRAGLAEHAADHGRHRQVDVPGPERLRLRQPVQLGQDRDAGHRAVGPVRVPQRQVRRAGHAVLPGHQRRPPDHLRARTTGSSSTTARRGSAAAEQFLLWLTAPAQVKYWSRCRPATCRPGSRWATRPR